VSGIFGLVHVGHRALDYHLERHNVLASNVANVDTPGFRPQELVRETHQSTRMSLPMVATQPEHFGLHQQADTQSFDVADERVVNGGNDENEVSLERELSKLGANHLRYESAAKLVQMQLGQLRYVASDGSAG
jgi:flagellar basal-body rod protein FlgB